MAEPLTSGSEENPRISRQSAVSGKPPVKLSMLVQQIHSEVLATEERIREYNSRLRAIEQEIVLKLLSNTPATQPYHLTQTQQILGWAFPLLIVVFTIVASYLPGPLGEATRQFFSIQR